MSAGRKLPKRLSVDTPRLEELIKVAESLGLNPQPNPEARYPRFWWQKSGYIIVDKRGTKGETLKALATSLLELRRLQATPRKV